MLDLRQPPKKKSYYTKMRQEKQYLKYKLTTINPARAHAILIICHSIRLGDQRPTRSPFSKPIPSKPAANLSACSKNSR